MQVCLYFSVKVSEKMEPFLLLHGFCLKKLQESGSIAVLFGVVIMTSERYKHKYYHKLTRIFMCKVYKK